MSKIEVFTLYTLLNLIDPPLPMTLRPFYSIFTLFILNLVIMRFSEKLHILFTYCL